MSFLSDVSTDMAQWTEQIQHGAAWLLGSVQLVEQDLTALKTTDPIVAEAADLAMNWATAKGVPITTLEQSGAMILNLAQTIAANKAAPAAASPPAPQPASSTEPTSG